MGVAIAFMKALLGSVIGIARPGVVVGCGRGSEVGGHSRITQSRKTMNATTSNPTINSLPRAKALSGFCIRNGPYRV